MTKMMSADEIKEEVRRFWSVLCAKSGDELAQFYSLEASVFSSSGERPEPGRVSAIRRKREYCHPGATLQVQLGPIEVLFLDGNAGIACYTFCFSATDVAGEFGAGSDESIKYGRATQVFMRDSESNLRIIHEHFSTATKK